MRRLGHEPGLRLALAALGLAGWLLAGVAAGEVVELMRLYNAPAVWLDWRPACVVAGWIIALHMRGVTRPDGTRSLGINATWSKRRVEP